MSESTHDDNNVESLDAIWSDISEDDQFELSSSDDGQISNSSLQRNEATDEDGPAHVYLGSPLLLPESIFLILTLGVAHNVNGSCLSDIISIINLQCIPGLLNKV